MAQGHSKVLGITHLLEFICGYDSGFGKKPAGGMAEAFAKQLNLNPQEVAVIGDTLHDIHMAKAANCISIGVASGLTPYSVLAKEADYMVDDLNAIQDLVCNL